MNIVQKHYDTKGGHYAPSKSRARRVLELISADLSGKRFLDIGCGKGEFGVLLKERGAHVTGCDISSRNVEKSKVVLDEAFVCDVENGDLKVMGSKKFDGILASELIEHLFSPKDFFKNLHELLVPSGFVIITTPNFLVWSNRIKMLLGKFEYTKSGFLDEGHIHFFTYRSFVKMAKETGWEIVKENHVIHPKIPQWLGRYFLHWAAYQIVAKLVPQKDFHKKEK